MKQSRKKADDLIAKMRDLLKRARLRCTNPRLQVGATLLQAKKPLSSKEIQERLPQGSCNEATLFRILNQFVEGKLVTVVSFGRRDNRYEISHDDDHHHHVLCIRCGKMAALEGCGVKPLVDQATKMGFVQLQHNLELTGLCSKCL